MRVAICDDEPEFLCRLDALVSNYSEKLSMTCEICHFENGETLIESDDSFNIIFLDIQMPGLSGIQTAETLRKRNPDFMLIFISAFMEFAPHGYEVQAFRYLIKSDLEGSFPACMKAALRHLGIHRRRVSFPFVDGEHYIYTDDIVYIESHKHVALFHLLPTGSVALRLYERLDNVQRALPPEEFLRIHKSFLVNMRFLERVSNYTAYLASGDDLPISQSRFSAVKRDFFRHKGKME